MADIFISYKKEEAASAETIAKAFEEQSWSVWWDRRLPAGDKFDETIRRELADAKLVVVLWSKKSLDSDYVIGEARDANGQEKLISVFIDDASEKELPYDLQAVQAERLAGVEADTTHETYQKLFADVAVRLGSAKTEREKKLESALSTARSEIEQLKSQLAGSQVKKLLPWAAAAVLGVAALLLAYFVVDGNSKIEELKQGQSAAIARKGKELEDAQAAVDKLKQEQSAAIAGKDAELKDAQTRITELEASKSGLEVWKVTGKVDIKRLDPNTAEWIDDVIGLEILTSNPADYDVFRDGTFEASVIAQVRPGGSREFPKLDFFKEGYVQQDYNLDKLEQHERIDPENRTIEIGTITFEPMYQ